MNGDDPWDEIKRRERREADQSIPLRCFGCKLEPEALEEYVDAAGEESMTPAEYVRAEEGTYHPETGFFYCTACYIEAEMPGMTECAAQFTSVEVKP